MTGTRALEELTAAARARTERDGLLQVRGLVEGRLREAHGRATRARSALADEQADVDRLESMSMTRVLAALRGRHDTDLERERAEAQAAGYRYAEERTRVEVEERELASVTARIAALGDVDARYGAALDARAAELRADPAAGDGAARLTAVAARAGELEAEERELVEAVTAAAHADDALGRAQQLLGSAGGWATYDTFFGGGLVGDLMKYDRLDNAAALVREADAALGRLAAELADVGIPAVGKIAVTDLTRAFDVWFDNIVSDWAVRDRISRAAARVHDLRLALTTTGQELQRRLAATREESARLHRERETLLHGAG